MITIAIVFQVNNINITINEEPLERVTETKYLGIKFDTNMRWSKHVEYLINKTSYLIFIFSKIAKFMDYNTLKIIYYALFYSQINYGIIAWGERIKSNYCYYNSFKNEF